MRRDADIWRERALRDAVLAGDAAAWRTWYDEHFARLAAYARWRCGGLADLADDVIQETWLNAIRRLRSFDPKRAAFFAWLCGVASNAARNAIRGRRRSAKRVQPLGDHEPANPESDRAAVEKAERTAAALAALPEHYEAVLRAKYLDGQTVEEIAAATGPTPKGIESLLSRARQAFREAYDATGAP
jgi:RNA polymerase sigma-70 factor (ECF subfamily)